MERNVATFGIGPQRCAICNTQLSLVYCGGCKVVSYCGIEHQTAHRSKHKAACNTIKKCRETLEDEELKLLTHPGDPYLPADPFITAAGKFYVIMGTRDYMKARFAVANSLLQVDTMCAVEKAVEHFTDMLRLGRSDNIGVRDILPALLLRLGREQECYDFIKWWAIIDDKDHYKGRYDWGDMSLPYLDIRGANAFEPLSIFSDHNLSLSQLLALTLLKVRLRLDLMPFEEDDDFESVLKGMDPQIDRPTGALVRDKLQKGRISDVSAMVKQLENQYRQLCRMVNDMNPYVWDSLMNGDTFAPPSSYTVGSPEEAHLALFQCKAAWDDTDDAINMIGDQIAEPTRVYERPAAVASASNPPISSLAGITDELGKKRGTGKVFPSRFEPNPTTSTPEELFPVTRTNTLASNFRFISRFDPRKTLVYTDGACSNNGQEQPKGGWAVVAGPPSRHGTETPCVVSGALESKGPFGDEFAPTSNRAELRATIAALRLCDWRSEGTNTVVIATDSTYVVDGATGWIKGWTRNGWKLRNGGAVKNRDLWELLLGEVELWAERGLSVELWHIPRELNTYADAAAKKAANLGSPETVFKDVFISLPLAKRTRTDPSTRVLALCLEFEPPFNTEYRSLGIQITSRVELEQATTPEAALSNLERKPHPAAILVTDGGLARQMKLWERVIDRLRGGATVILAGRFSSMVNVFESSSFFAKVGLPWKMASYYRTTLNLQAGGVDGSRKNRLPTTYFTKAVFVKGFEQSAAWYTSDENSKEAAVVFAKVGNGRLGYIGDVSDDIVSEHVILAMLGLLEE